MNLHPIFVHFPIALLTLYALMELARFKWLMARPYWFYAKAVLLIAGGLGALAALLTGDMAKLAVRQGEFHPAIANFKQVVNMHENFADASAAIFGVLAASYLILWLSREGFAIWLGQRSGLQKIWGWLVKPAEFFAQSRLVIFLALAGLICITITGGLGGAMVYGPNADPFFGVIYKMLFP